VADRGWNPKACFIGVGRNGAIISQKLKTELGKLMAFYYDYKEQNPKEFYELSVSPIFDIFLLEALLDDTKVIDTAQYHFVFMVNGDEDEISISNTKIVFKNEPFVSITIATDKRPNKRCFKNETLAILPDRELHNTACDFMIDIMRFQMFPRFVSFDLSDFKAIHRRSVNILYFNSYRTNYENEFYEFYKANVEKKDINKDAMVIFYFQDCEDVMSYFLKQDNLNIYLFSDHCASPTSDKLKALIIS
jgi:hypothetical protein